MKRKLLVALGLAVVVSLAVAAPALAYSGVSGIVINSLDLQPWTYGGEVWIVNNTTGDIEATCRLNTTTGAIEDGSGGSCDYGDSTLTGVSVNADATAPASGDQMEVVIDFGCSVDGAATCPSGSPPSGTPGFSSTPYTESAIPFVRNLGYIKTGTGPNAIVLADVTTQSSNVWLPAALAVVALIGAGGVVLLLRRRRVA
jgi:hypothetical protein